MAVQALLAAKTVYDVYKKADAVKKGVDGAKQGMENISSRGAPEAGGEPGEPVDFGALFDAQNLDGGQQASPGAKPEETSFMGAVLEEAFGESGESPKKETSLLQDIGDMTPGGAMSPG